MENRNSCLEAIILAGGFGTRLRPVIGNCPKALVKIGNLYLIEYLLKQAESLGISKAILAVGVGASRIKEALGKKRGKMTLVYSEEKSPLGTGGALRLASKLCASERLMIMNGDSYFYTDLDKARLWHLKKRSEATILLAQVPDSSRFGRVKVDRDGKILSFEEKNKEAGQGLINAGIYFIDKKLILEKVPLRRPVSLESEIFPQWIGKEFYGYRSVGHFIDIGTPEAYRKRNTFFESLFSVRRKAK